VLVLVWIYVLAVVLYVNDFHVFAGILGIWALWRTIRVTHARHVSQSQTQFLRQLVREQEWLYFRRTEGCEQREQVRPDLTRVRSESFARQPKRRGFAGKHEPASRDLP
jgi:hypothetical protein